MQLTQLDLCTGDPRCDSSRPEQLSELRFSRNLETTTNTLRRCTTTMHKCIHLIGRARDSIRLPNLGQACTTLPMTHAVLHMYFLDINICVGTYKPYSPPFNYLPCIRYTLHCKLLYHSNFVRVAISKMRINVISILRLQNNHCPFAKFW